MSKFTLTIKNNETQETVKEIELNAAIIGCACNDDMSGMTLLEGTGGELFGAVHAASTQIERARKKYPVLDLILQLGEIAGTNGGDNDEK